jgi:hypothetical protein
MAEVKNTKRRKANQPDSQSITLTIKYSQLAVEDDGHITIQATENEIPNPLPIFVYGVKIIKKWYIICTALLK